MNISERLSRFSEHFPDLTPEISHLVQSSEYAADWLIRYPDFAALFATTWEHYDFSAAWQKEVISDENALLRALRLFKHRHQVALIYALTTGKIAQTTFLTAISQLAQCLTEAALTWQYQALTKRYGLPCDKTGQPQQMVVLGMGKFGGGELNFSSDIDLIFAYPSVGETRAEGRQKSQDNEVFFRKLAQKLIYSLDTTTAEGMVYRVDMRLRPFGQTGPLALSFDAMEQYYLIHGRDWERYAMMKARPVAGDIKEGKRLLKMLRPFIYRRYLDHRALHAIANIKRDINQQIRQEGMELHVKLGAGGIREAEFAVQALQMVYGGQYPTLQTPSFLQALGEIEALKLWTGEECETLRQAYLLLRTAENALQFEREQQTHLLPQENVDWERLALATGFSDIQTLKTALQQARSHIHAWFKGIFAQQEQQMNKPHQTLQQIDWSSPDAEQLILWLKTQPLEEEQREKIITEVQKFSRQVGWNRLPRQTIKRIDRLLPKILQQIIECPEMLTGLAGLLAVISAVIGRSVYIEMLAEQPSLTRHLLNIAADSAWLIQFIADHPLVLDDVISARPLEVGREALKNDLTARLKTIEDEETWQHALRDFKHVQVFKTAWADIHEHLPLMKVSDQLTDIAELTLQTALDHTAKQLQQKHGIPRDQNGNPAQIAIIAYGKLGGLELGYGSDLDIIYLYDDGNSQGSTDGKKPLDNLVYFTRLAQRMTNLLSTTSINGSIYDIDTRLRPGGKSGLLVSSLQSFIQYQQQNAWTWEHQALTRARPVAGDEQLAAAFIKVRAEILACSREDTLRDEILNMRQKMLENHQSEKQVFHLKHDLGGLIDIEFIVQYLILKYAAHEPILTRMTDNIRQLAALEAVGLLPSLFAMTLRDAYRQLRREAHHRYLNGQDRRVSPQPWQEVREKVQAIWKVIFKI